MITYTYRIRWRNWDFPGFSDHCIEAVHPSSMRLARVAAEEAAKICGWTPRKWFQVWRWFEGSQ
jgi:hypothetical protein